MGLQAKEKWQAERLMETLTSSSLLASCNSGWELQTQLKRLYFPLLNYGSLHLKPNKLNRSAASGCKGSSCQQIYYHHKAQLDLC